MTHDPEIDVKRLRLAPGDVVILSLPGRFSADQAAHAREVLANALSRAGHGQVPVVIKTDEIDLTVLGPNEPGAMTTVEGGAPR